LIGGETQVEQNAVDARDSELIQDLWQLRITGLPQDAARVGKTLGRPGEHQGIAIKSDEFSGGTEVFEEDATMASGSDRPVNDDQPWLDVEKLDDFPYEDGPMNGRALVSRGPRRIRHYDEWCIMDVALANGSHPPPRDRGENARKHPPRPPVVRKTFGSGNPKKW